MKKSRTGRNDYRSAGPANGLEYSNENGQFYYESAEDEYDADYDDDEYEYYDEPERKTSYTIAYILAVMFASIGIAVLMWLAADDVLALTKTDNVITITVGEDETFEEVTEDLANHGLVRYRFLFELYGKFSHAEDKINPGTYELNQQYDYHALVNEMATGSESRKTVTLTFPEGYSVDQIFEMLADNGVCTIDDLKDTAANYGFELSYLADVPLGDYTRLEGFMFPDTYEFYVDDDPVRVINKFLNNFDSKITDSMLSAIDDLNADLRARMEEEGSFTEEEIESSMMDIYKIMTVASLIEKEAGADSERTMIASVIYNRLTTRVHELLQIDATVEYALGEHKATLTANDLSVDSPYNTYKYKGLPPGPIANPGIASIMAAIYPDDTDYFFYSLTDSGTHKFFKTYIEQQDYLNGTDTAEETTEETTDDTSDEAEGGQETTETPQTTEGQEGTILVQ